MEGPSEQPVELPDDQPANQPPGVPVMAIDRVPVQSDYDMDLLTNELNAARTAYSQVRLKLALVKAGCEFPEKVHHNQMLTEVRRVAKTLHAIEDLSRTSIIPTPADGPELEIVGANTVLASPMGIDPGVA